jgi:poly(A) polymerase
MLVSERLDAVIGCPLTTTQEPYPEAPEGEAEEEAGPDGEAGGEEDGEDAELEEEADPLLALPVDPEALRPEPAPPPPPEDEIPEHTPTVAAAPVPALPLHTPDGQPAEIDPSRFDPDALKVIHRLNQFGYEAYFVGGCVRDLLLGRKPKDFDIATSAHPNEVRDAFRNCRLIGRRFRLAHVYFKGGKIVEVSTFRANPTELEELEPPAAEGPENGGGPGAGEEEERSDLLITHDNVFGTAEQDARRRDFTINGLFYDVFQGKVIDYVRGLRDLRERQIRTIGDPEVRMREDPVRILRAVRFACKLGLDIESRTYAAMEGAVEDLPRCAPPRLLEETFRLIRGGVAAPALKLLEALDALKLLLPPIHRYLREGGAEAERTFQAYAAALDRRVLASAEALEDAILLSALLVPLSRTSAPPASPEGERPSVAQAIEDLLRQFVQSARLPRRIAERTRMILLAQRTLAGDRRRRGSLASFRRHPLFSEALTVFELSVEATGEGAEALAAWKSGGSPAIKATADAASGQRRRRRRRRRGPPGQGPGSGPGDAPRES